MRWLKLTGEILWICLLPYRLIFRALPPLLQVVVLVAVICVIGAAPMMCSTTQKAVNAAVKVNAVEYRVNGGRPDHGSHRQVWHHRIDRSHLIPVGYPGKSVT